MGKRLQGSDYGPYAAGRSSATPCAAFMPLVSRLYPRVPNTFSRVSNANPATTDEQANACDGDADAIFHCRDLRAGFLPERDPQLLLTVPVRPSNLSRYRHAYQTRAKSCLSGGGNGSRSASRLFRAWKRTLCAPSSCFQYVACHGAISSHAIDTEDTSSWE